MMTKAQEHQPRGRLLIFDDDSSVSYTIGAIARGAGFDSRWVDRSADFFQLLEEWSPTHIALDLVMPNLDGIEVVRLLGERHCKAHIIITSGMGDRILAAAQQAGLEQGLRMMGPLPKPFSSTDLRSLLSASWHDDLNSMATPASPLSAPHEVTEEALLRGIEHEEFVMYYQPKVSCDTGALAGFEALVRWQCPGKGIVMPDSFIPLAERTGLIAPLTEQIISQSLDWLSASFANASPLLSINLSAKSLNHLDIADHFADHCAHYDILPSRLILEVTETCAMTDATVALAALTRLRLKGFNLSIDDFGVGYSSLAQLARLPFSELKIDKMFVSSASNSKESRMIVKGIVGLAHGLGLRVTAEGVEDECTLDFLRDVECDLAQGYFIGKPMDTAAVTSWMALTYGTAIN
ncbi:EAL domain-containing response regulator [Oceanibaculum pacificum]|uniref:Diguanylate phosphodiesterase n=1 Tax=Oceanibaculum pacificum TaxID=580166 RepID=A0A154VXX4_9PROT|nr:EAL domain-containing response regulator [Oceanibaculum pacificum]KZD06192.1 hypothetical protein AUP43_11140 [Oceanibaculum pacificum]